MPTAAAVGFLLKANAIDMLWRIKLDMDKNVTSPSKPIGAPVPQRIKLAVGALEVLAVVALAYFVVQLFYSIATPLNPPTPEVYAVSKIGSNSEPQIDFTTVSAFDPFFRQTSSETVTATAAPESNLRITIAGIRAIKGDDSSGFGTAIVNTDGDGQKLVKIGDEVAPGAELAAVYSDRIEIRRRGLRETIYMRKPVSGAATQNSHDGAETQAVKITGGEGDWVQRLLSDIPFEPVRSDGRLIGFRIGDTDQTSFLNSVGLEQGDVVLAVAGSPLTSFERLTELSEELDTSRTIVLDIDRRGEQISVTVGG